MQRFFSPRIVVLLAAALAVAGFFAFGLHELFSLERLKAEQAHLAALLAKHPMLVTVVFFAIYVAFAAFSLPAAALMTLLAGALFGVVWGTVLVSFASTLGATLAMLGARYVLQDSVQHRYGKQLHKVQETFQREGAFYLFALRLVPAVPFFMVNLLMGLLPIRPLTFWWVSQLGMLPGTAAYVYAGTALASIHSLGDVLSVHVLLAFALVGLLPIMAKHLLKKLRNEK